jgi:hypothetical protein
MAWKLFWIAFGVWIFHASHYALLGGLKQLRAMGVPVRIEGNKFLIASEALAHLALLNILVFAIIYGFRVSWGHAAFILFGGYAASLLYIIVLRGPALNNLVKPTHQLAWVSQPVLSGLLWYVAFA